MSNDLIIIEPIDPDEIILPEVPSTINDDKALARRDAIKNHSLVIRNRELGANSIEVVQPRNKIKEVLGLDSDKEARIFLSNLNDDDVHEDNVLLPALYEHAFINAEVAETSEAKEEALDILQCLDSVAQCPSLREERVMLKEKMDLKWPSFRKQQLDQRGTEPCVLTGAPQGDEIDLHHLRYRSDQPEHMLNPDYVGPANRPPHQKHHNEEKKQASKDMKQEKKAIEGLALGSTVTATTR